ncbi:MAG: transcription initiation factor IIB family protein [Candidatus Geothermarchaeales archaeon]
MCGGQSFLWKRESGEVVCGDCGTVLYTDNIDPGPEWRAYSEEHKERRRRVGSPLTLLDADLGLSSTFSRSVDIVEFAARRRKMKRLIRIQLRTHSPMKKRIDRILQEIKVAGEKLTLARYEMETAAKIARKAILMDDKKRWNNTALAIASLYIACRLDENAKRLSEFMKVICDRECNKRDVIKAYRILTTNLKIRPPLMSEKRILKLITKRLKLRKEILVLANELIKEAKRARVGIGKNPGSIAAASVYIAYKLLGIKVTQRDICSAAKTTEVTLRSRIRDIMKNLSITVEV